MSETPRGSSAVSHDAEHGSSHGIVSVHGVRYQVKDVARAVAFYTGHLGFTLEHQQLPAFASVSLGDAQILLSGPDASGSRPMPNGQRQKPGGWNRVVLKVKDLPACIVSRSIVFVVPNFRFRSQGSRLRRPPGSRKSEAGCAKRSCVAAFAAGAGGRLADTMTPSKAQQTIPPSIQCAAPIASSSFS